MSLKLATNGSSKSVLSEDFAMNPEMQYGGALATNYTYVNAVPLSGYTPGSKITIDLPQECISMKDAYLQFQMTGSAGNTAGLLCSIVPDIRSLISRVVLQIGSKVILDISEFGLLNNIFDYTRDPQWANAQGRVMLATGVSQGGRNIKFGNPNLVYAARLNISDEADSIFSKILPLMKVGSTMQLQIYLQQDPSRVISTTTAVTGTIPPSFALNNVQFHYYTIVPSDSWNSMINERIMAGALTFSARGFDYTQDTSLFLAGTQNASKTLNFKYSSLLGFICAFQPQSYITSYTNDTKMQYFYNPGLTTFRCRVGGNQYPMDNSTSDADMYGRFSLFFGLDDDTPTSAANSPYGVGSDTWSYVSGALPTAASFIPCVNLCKYPNEIATDGRVVVDGLDTSIATNVQLDIQLGTVVPQNMVTHIWAYYNYTITINPNGSVSLNF